jgi:hypothetical protein
VSPYAFPVEHSEGNMFRNVLTLVVVVAACRTESRTSQQPTRETDSLSVWLNLMRDSLPDLYELFSTSAALGVQMTLNSLGFRHAPYTGTLDDATRAATREYEAARSLPVTGNPYTNATFKRLKEDFDRFARLSSPAVNNRWFTDVSWQRGFMDAEGPWVLPQSDFPAAIKLICDRQRGECILAEAEYGENESLVPHVDFYQIESWDAAEIRSKPSDSICERAVLTVNRPQQSVVLNISTINRSGDCHFLYKDTTAIEGRSYHLASSDEISNRSRGRLGAVFDTLVNTNEAVRRSLAKWKDTSFLRRAMTPRARPGSR